MFAVHIVGQIRYTAAQDFAVSRAVYGSPGACQNCTITCNATNVNFEQCFLPLNSIFFLPEMLKCQVPRPRGWLDKAGSWLANAVVFTVEMVWVYAALFAALNSSSMGLMTVSPRASAPIIHARLMPVARVRLLSSVATGNLRASVLEWSSP